MHFQKTQMCIRDSLWTTQRVLWKRRVTPFRGQNNSTSLFKTEHTERAETQILCVIHFKDENIKTNMYSLIQVNQKQNRFNRFVLTRVFQVTGYVSARIKAIL